MIWCQLFNFILFISGSQLYDIPYISPMLDETATGKDGHYYE